MKSPAYDRRKFIRSAAAATSAAGLLSVFPKELLANNNTADKKDTHQYPAVIEKNRQAKIRFSVIGINHGHIYGQADAVMRGGGELISFHAKEDELATEFSKKYPQAKRVM